jgi:hypothetical protein
LATHNPINIKIEKMEMEDIDGGEVDKGGEVGADLSARWLFDIWNLTPS